RMSESLMSRKPLHKRLSRGFATCRSLPPSMGKTCRQKLPGGWPQGCEMPGARSGRWRGRQRPVPATPPAALPVSCHNPSLQVDGMIIGSTSGREQGGPGLTLTEGVGPPTANAASMKRPVSDNLHDWQRYCEALERRNEELEARVRLLE